MRSVVCPAHFPSRLILRSSQNRQFPLWEKYPYPWYALSTLCIRYSQLSMTTVLKPPSRLASSISSGVLESHPDSINSDAAAAVIHPLLFHTPFPPYL